MSNRNELSLWNENSWRPLAELRREMDRLFDDFWSTPTVRAGQTQTQFMPACELEEEANHYLVTLEMPGVSKDDVKIEVLDNQIVVSGERHHERKNKENGTWYSERRFGRFHRSFTLPAGIDADKIEANYQDGVLRLMVPKAESAKPRQIKITNGTSTGFFGRLLGQSKSDKEESRSSSESKPEKVA